MTALTGRQREVLEFIRESVRVTGYPPTVREICAELKLSAPSTVHAHLANLERLGFIRRDPPSRVPWSLWETCGRHGRCRWSAAWPPACLYLAEQNIEEYVDVPALLRRGDDDFLLRVHGDSMADAGIYDGDYIVIHQQHSAENGTIVVAMLEDEATTKRFYQEGNRVRLQPENELYEPIVVDEGDVQIIGTVVGVLRKL